jgi:hypothetical protein
MNARLLFCMLLSVAACNTPRPVERAAQVPPLVIEQPVVVLDPVSRTDADQSAPAPLTEVQKPAVESQPVESQPVETQSAETQAPVQSAVQSTGPIYRSMTRVVETPPAEKQDNAASEPAATGGATASQPQRATRLPPHVSFHAGVYHDPACGFFPVHTAIGTSVGAAIGSHHGNAHRGAMIGASAGFFLDMAHMWHH